MSPDTGPLSVGTPAAEFPAHSPQRLRASFEFSPPRTEVMERTLWEAVTRLAPLRPTFFSVTYGAGGSTRQRTHDTVVRLKKETGIDPAAHLTCVGATKGEIDDVARAYEEMTGRAVKPLEWFEVFAALRFAVVSIRTSTRGIAYGTMEKPDDPDDLVMFRSLLEQMLDGSYWT